MRWALISSILSILLAACNISTPNVTPTPEVLLSDTPTPQQTATPTITLSPMASPTITPNNDIVPVLVATALPTQPVVPAIETLPTATPGPCAVTIQAGETLTAALLRVPCDNRVSNGLLQAVVAFNENLSNADFVFEGLELLVPRPSPTPIPEGLEITQTAAAQAGLGDILGNVGFVQGTEFGCHEIQEGENAILIADLYNATLEQLSQLNQNIIWSGCDFRNPSGGPSCSPQISTGTCMTVPLPTGTPVPTSTPSGNETPTPLPTVAAIIPVFPPQDGIAPAGSGTIKLQWVGATGLLAADEVYLVEVVDRTSNVTENFATRSNQFELPARLIPTDGQTHRIEWRVTVARRNADGSITPLNINVPYNRFSWQSS